LKQKAWLRGMANFPIVVKAKHLRLLREHISKIHDGMDFMDIWTTIRGDGGYLSAFCIIADYLFEYHRNEYNFHIERRNGAVDGEYAPIYQPEWNSTYIISKHENEVKEYYTTNNTVPRPRSMMHAGWYPGLGHIKGTHVPPRNKHPGGIMQPSVPTKHTMLLEQLYTRGYCLAGGILSSPLIDSVTGNVIMNWKDACLKYSITATAESQGHWKDVELHFSMSDWSWDERAADEVKKFYKNKWDSLKKRINDIIVTPHDQTHIVTKHGVNIGNGNGNGNGSGHDKNITNAVQIVSTGDWGKFTREEIEQGQRLMGLL
jgi:hypothetical protein